MNYRKIALAAAALCMAIGAGAQTSGSTDESDSHNPLEFKRTSEEVRTILSRHRPTEAQSVPVPRFVVKSRNNSFIMAIGGVVNPIIGYDIGNNLYSCDGAGINFVTAAIPVPARPAHKGDFFINGINGNVDLQITGLAGTPNEISAYVKVGTNGINTQVALKRAYITWKHFQMGRQQTLAQDADACQPPTIDPQGPSGMIATTVHEIAYKSPDYDGFRWAAALDMPTYYSSNGIYYGKDYPIYDGHQVDISAEQYIPDIPAWAEYTFSPDNRIRLTGILRNFHYRDRVESKTRYTPGFGLILSGNLRPVKPLLLYYQFAYGKGIGAYIQDLAGIPCSYTPDSKHPGKMKGTEMAGLTVGATYEYSDRLQFNAMFSESRVWNVMEYATRQDNANYKYGLYGAVNAFYKITPYLTWGVEYLWGHRQTWTEGGAHDSRIQTQLAFHF